jgi:hypothetical protein
MHDHECKKQGAQLLMIQVGDFSELLTDDAVHSLELLEEPEVMVVVLAECCMLYAKAAHGTEASSCIRLQALIHL